MTRRRAGLHSKAVRLAWLAQLAIAIPACGVPEPFGSTGGLGDAAAPTGRSDGAAESCGRGFSVVETSVEFASANVALVDLDGRPLSESFVSSATSDVGLEPSPSGDAVPPTMPSFGSDLVLVDRDPAARILWFDLGDGSEIARLDVGHNPHDYARLAPDKAYVTRYDGNSATGSEPFDGGNDILVIDPTEPKITGSIDLSEAMLDLGPELSPRPDRIVVSGDRAYVVLAPSTADFQTTETARLAAIDAGADRITDVLVLEGLHGCEGLSLAPTGDFVVVGCVAWDGSGGARLDRTGLAVVDLEPELRLRDRIMASELGVGALGFYVAIAGPDTVLASVIGSIGSATAPDEPDRLVEVDLASRTARELVRRAEPFSIGDVRCAPSCGVCIAADAGVPGGLLQVMRLEGGRVVDRRQQVVERRYSMPPRYIGRF